MTVKEAFRAGFEKRCAELGLSPTQTEERAARALALLEKKALDMSWLQRNNVDPRLALQLAIAAPVAVGALGGYAAHKMTAPDADEEDVRKQELVTELKHWTRRAREQQKARALVAPPTRGALRLS